MWPSTGLIDKKGKIRAAWEGELDWESAGTYRKVEKAIEALRKESDEAPPKEAPKEPGV
jgi:peroxiredoxin